MPKTPYASSPKTGKPLLVLRLLNIVVGGRLIFRDEVVSSMAGQPARELGQFFAQSIDRLLVHVCLGNELGEGDY